jgi:hypothetical protein
MSKKILSVCVLLFCAFSLWSAHLGPFDAKEVARQWFTVYAAPDFQYMGIDEVIPVSGTDEVLFYIINLKQDGWILVSAEDQVDVVLGYSYRGKFQQPEGNTAVNTLLENHKQTIRRVQAGEIILAPRPAKPESLIQSEPVEAVAPLLSSLWQQGAPYNQDTPLESGLPTYVGCGALSSGQIMHYWQYPEHGTGYYDGIDFQNTYYQWAYMPDSVDTQSPQQEIDAVAQLLHHVGVALDMRYHATSPSLSSDSDIDDMFRDFFDYSATFEYGISIGYSNLPGVVRQDIDKGWPVQFNGYSYTYGGHAFVCDGYEVRADGTYLHFNFGWGGIDDGYYKLFSVNCPETGYDFNKKYTIVHYIRPNKTLVAIPMPRSPQVEVQQETSQQFNLRADHLNGSPLTYTWKVDGNVVPETSGTLSYSFPQLKVYTVNGSVTDGALVESFAWTVQVVERTPDQHLPPQNLTLESSPDAISLFWNAPEGVTSVDAFYIYRNGTYLASVPGEQTSYDDENFLYDTDYQYYVSAHYTFPEGESPASNTVSANVPAPPLYFEETFESGTFSSGWSITGPASWTVSDLDAGEGVYCAKSPYFSGDGAAEISFQHYFPTAGTISFQKRTYTSRYSDDYFRFYIDGQLTAEWKEQKDWETVTYSVPAGSHTFTWAYEKVGFVSSKFFVRIDAVLANPN